MLSDSKDALDKLPFSHKQTSKLSIYRLLLFPNVLVWHLAATKVLRQLIKLNLVRYAKHYPV
jgi:hypothetical protein